MEMSVISVRQGEECLKTLSTVVSEIIQTTHRTQTKQGIDRGSTIFVKDNYYISCSVPHDYVDDWKRKTQFTGYIIVICTHYTDRNRLKANILVYPSPLMVEQSKTVYVVFEKN